MASSKRSIYLNRSVWNGDWSQPTAHTNVPVGSVCFVLFFVSCVFSFSLPFCLLCFVVFLFFFFLVSFIPTGGHHLFPSWLISFIQTVGIFGKVNGPNHRPARPRWRLSIPAPSTGRINGWIEHHINVFFSLHNIIIWFMYKPIENWIRIRQWIE